MSLRAGPEKAHVAREILFRRVLPVVVSGGGSFRLLAFSSYGVRKARTTTEINIYK